MPRVRLKPRDHYSFQTTLKVRITDLNYGGHLGNDRLLSLIHEARVVFLNEHQFSEMDCGGVSLILADATVNYLGEAFGGDALIFEVAAGEPSNSGFRLFFRVTRSSESATIALVENGMVCFDYESRTIERLPETAAVLFE